MCAEQLEILEDKITEIDQKYSSLDNDFIEMNELIAYINGPNSLLSQKVDALNVQLENQAIINENQVQQVTELRQLSQSMTDTNLQINNSILNLEASVRQLWVNQPPAASESELSHKILMVDATLGSPFASSGSRSIDPNFKPSFKQVFDPNTSTIAAFLDIYETSMKRAPDELKQEHILTCLNPVFQEVVVSELAAITICEEMKALLTEEFGGELILEVKKNAFMHISFQPKETFSEFSNYFYIEGQ